MTACGSASCRAQRFPGRTSDANDTDRRPSCATGSLKERVPRDRGPFAPLADVIGIEVVPIPERRPEVHPVRVFEQMGWLRPGCEASCCAGSVQFDQGEDGGGIHPRFRRGTVGDGAICRVPPRREWRDLLGGRDETAGCHCGQLAAAIRRLVRRSPHDCPPGHPKVCGFHLPLTIGPAACRHPPANRSSADSDWSGYSGHAAVPSHSVGTGVGWKRYGDAA